MIEDREDWEMAQAALAEQFEAEHPFDRATLTVGERTFRILVARTPEQRARGMVGRRFSWFDAMLFDFGETKVARFHNHGVPVAILIAFYTETGELVGVETMQPGGGEVSSKDPCRYALELPVDDRGRGILPEDLKFLAELAPRVCDCENYTGSENGRCERCGGVLTAQEIKKSKEEANLRAADPKAPESCPNCTFFLGTGVCELVESAGVGLVCNEFTAMNKDSGTYPSRSVQISHPSTRTV